MSTALAEIITIGDELLIGQVLDTNSAWIAQRLNDAGIKVFQMTSVSDSEEHILSALSDAQKRSDIILVTGGLGPTKDDLTKFVLCKFYKSNLRFDEASFLQIEKLFKARGKTVTEVNRKQAEVPEKCEALINTMGTAPGMWFHEKGKVLVSMPGVPHEMKTMMENDVLPRLRKLFAGGVIVHRTIWFQGIGESYLSDLVESWELALPPQVKLAYLPAIGLLRLRLSSSGNSREVLERLIQQEVEKLQAIAGEYIFGENEDRLEELAGKLLLEKKSTVSTAESCTGGYIAHRITSVAGCSAYFMGSLVAYDNSIKENILGVDATLIDNVGAVSDEVVRAMADNARMKFKTDYAIATSGVAGPSGGTAEKPVGTVYLAIAHPGGIYSRKLQLGTSRERVIMEATQYALNDLRKIILGKIA